MYSDILESIEIKGKSWTETIAICSYREANTFFVFQVGVIYGSPEVTAGGNALKYYASVRLDTRRKEVLPENTGIRVKVKVVKNKVAAPFKAVMLDINFGSGIDSLGCMLDAAVDLDIVERRGSWFSYKGKQLAQGRVKVIELMKTKNEMKDEIENDVRQALSRFGREEDVESKEAGEPELEPEMEVASMEGEESPFE